MCVGDVFLCVINVFAFPCHVGVIEDYAPVLLFKQTLFRLLLVGSCCEVYLRLTQTRTDTHKCFVEPSLPFAR